MSSSIYSEELTAPLLETDSAQDVQTHSSIFTPKQIESPFQFGLELEYHQKRVQLTNPASFDFLDYERKVALIRELELSIDCFRKQKQVEINYSRYRKLKSIQEQIELCEKYIRQLNDETEVEIISVEHQKTMAMAIAIWIRDKLKHLSNNMFQVSHDILDPLNGCRLYWVWGGSLLQDVLGILSGKLLNIDLATIETSAPSYSLGMLSWLLYYTTFFLDVFMLLKHTIPGPWMTEEEKKRGWKKRLEEQWQARKFRLINDAVWATANLLCFYWLTGDGVKGYIGNGVTVVLLVADLMVSIWKFIEEKRQHKKEILQLTTEISFLKDKNKNTGTITDNQLEMQIAQLEKMKAEKERNWYYRRLSHINNITSALAYAITCNLFFATATSFAGSAICFALTVIYNAVSAGIELAKAKAIGKELQEELASLEERFDNEPNEQEKKLIYLQIMEVLAQSEYQRKQVRYAALELTRTILVDALLPFMVFAFSVYVPMAAVMPPALAGFLIIGLAFAISIGSKKLLEWMASPKEAEKAVFNESAYNEFCKGRQSANLEDIETVLSDEEDVEHIDSLEFSAEDEVEVTRTPEEDRVLLEHMATFFKKPAIAAENASEGLSSVDSDEIPQLSFQEESPKTPTRVLSFFTRQPEKEHEREGVDMEEEIELSETDEQRLNNISSFFARRRAEHSPSEDDLSVSEDDEIAPLLEQAYAG